MPDNWYALMPGGGAMTRSGGVVRLVTAVCSCSWTGQLGATASCPVCGRNYHARITPQRADMLDKLKERATALADSPMMRHALIKFGLVIATGPQRAAGGDGRRRPQPRAHALTEQGENARAAYRAMEHEQKLRREIVAEAAGRHADLAEAP